jgi:hypothetical protein
VQLVHGLALVDAVNSTHLMLQVAMVVMVMVMMVVVMMYGADSDDADGGGNDDDDASPMVWPEFSIFFQFIEGASGKVLDESWITQHEQR